MKFRKSVQVGLLTAGVALIWWVAWKQVEHALDCDNGIAVSRYDRARTLKRLGRLNEAESMLKLAVGTACAQTCSEGFDANLRPGIVCWPAEFRRALAYHYSATRRYDECVNWYQDAADLEPKLEMPVLQSIAWCHMQAGDAEAALETIGTKRERFPDAFTSKDADFERSVRYAIKLAAGGEQVTALFKYVPAPEVGPVSDLRIRGNWTAEGEQSDAFGYADTPLERLDDGSYRGNVALQKFSTHPYQVVVTSSSGRTIGFERFRIADETTGTQTVTIKSARETAFFALKRRSRPQRPKTTADGRRRVFIFWPDGGSWWLLRSLVERGLAPNTRDLIDRGARGVMISEPPITSVAMQRITTFTSELSTWDTLKRQLKGIQALDAYIDIDQGGEDSVAAFLAARKIRFVDLTFNEPFLQNQGDQARKLGFDPDQHIEYRFDPTRSKIAKDSIIHSYLDVDRITGLVGESNRPQKWTLATQWDDTEDKFSRALRIFSTEGGPEVMLLRLPAVDVMSHMFFENTDAYSESNALLEALYVYLDDAIGRVRAGLDADDMLLFISDHGVRNKISHDPKSLFIGEGQGLEPGSAIAPFPIEKFPFVLVSLLLHQTLPVAE